MATEAATVEEGLMTEEEVPQKPVMLVGIDDSEESFYALEWALDHFFVPHTPYFPFDLILIHAKSSKASAVGLGGQGAAEVMPVVDSDLKKIAVRVTDRAKQVCITKSVDHVRVEIWDGDAKNMLCEAVDKHHVSILVVGSRGYGAIKRAVLGSVSDYCAHHAHCSVMIVKCPKNKN